MLNGRERRLYCRSPPLSAKFNFLSSSHNPSLIIIAILCLSDSVSFYTMSTPSSTPPRSDADGTPPQGRGSTFTSLLARARVAAGGGGPGATAEDASVSSVGGNSFASTVDDDDGDTSGAAGEFV